MPQCCGSENEDGMLRRRVEFLISWARPCALFTGVESRPFWKRPRCKTVRLPKEDTIHKFLLACFVSGCVANALHLHSALVKGLLSELSVMFRVIFESDVYHNVYDISLKTSLPVMYNYTMYWRLHGASEDTSYDVSMMQAESATPLLSLPLCMPY